jgi:hypothetical protein
MLGKNIQMLTAGCLDAGEDYMYTHFVQMLTEGCLTDGEEYTDAD